ncbi:MAG: hypothetical protein LBO65_06600 [Spirochaetaceae bacterium]|jgi:hypothetical protein|nr:hypothetical protein [Spirochaetaceae bacterium]
MKGNLTTTDRPAKTRGDWVGELRTRFSRARTLLGRLIKWTVWAVMALDLGGALWYVIGSYRKRGDASQLLVVRFCLIVSLLLVISALYGLILDLFYMVRQRRAAFLIGVFGYMLIMALGSCLFLAAAFIIGAAGGNL